MWCQQVRSFSDCRHSVILMLRWGPAAQSAVVFPVSCSFHSSLSWLFLIPIDIPAWVSEFSIYLFRCDGPERKRQYRADDSFFGALYGLAFPILMEPLLLKIYSPTFNFLNIHFADSKTHAVMSAQRMICIILPSIPSNRFHWKTLLKLRWRILIQNL
jgi:hypothetical protein